MKVELAVTFILSLLIVLCGIIPTVSAQGTYGPYRPVYVDIEMLTLEEVNGVTQTFSADFFMVAVYQDDTVSVVPGEEDTPLPSSAAYDSVEFEFVNSQSVTEQYRHVFATTGKPSIMDHYNATVPPVASLPWIRQEARLQGVFKSDFDLRNFPFDFQTVVLQLESSNSNYTVARFAPDYSSDILERLKPLNEYTVEGTTKELTTAYYHVFNETYSRLDFKIRLKRIPAFYLDKIVSGVAILVIMCWLLFTLPVMDSNRQTTAAANFLAVVAYIFILTSDVPKVPYTTRIGLFINISIGEIFGVYTAGCVQIAIARFADHSKETALAAAKDEMKQKIKDRERVRKDKVRARRRAAKQQKKQGGAEAMTVEDSEGVPEQVPLQAPIRAPPCENVSSDDDEDDEDLNLDDVEVEGWWDTYEEKALLIDVVLCVVLIIPYIIATPILLRH